jgi:hypothetical protein
MGTPLKIMNQKLKIGLMLDSFNIPAWVYSVIQRIQLGNSGQFSLVILNDGNRSNSHSSSGVNLYSMLNRVDEKLFSKKPDPNHVMNAKELLAEVPVLSVAPKDDGEILFLGEADLDAIRDYQLDILVKFGIAGLMLEALNVSKYGTWFYYHGDDRLMKCGPPGFWEVVENWSETGAAIIAMGGRFSPNRVLFRSHFFTYPLSPARHRSYYFWATTTFLPRQIERLHSLGEEKFLQETEKFNRALLRKVKNYEEPSNQVTLQSAGKLVRRLMAEFFKRVLWVDQWYLLFSFQKDQANNFNEYRKLIPGRDVFWADPHVIHTNGKYYIFIEEYSRKNRKGHISVIELDEQGNASSPVTILEKDYHLSYPFVFEWQGVFYMVPESLQNRTIDLYQCVEFPHTWVHNQCLMENVSAVDTTLIQFAGRWWLFTAIAENEAGAPNVELFLFSREHLLEGDWKAHPQNPIVSDVKCARPAGSIFLKEGKLFRPSQDCSHLYGYGFDLNEVTVLSEKNYSERKTLSVRPGWDEKILGTHTYAKKDNLTIIDVFTHIRKFAKNASVGVMHKPDKKTF